MKRLKIFKIFLPLIGIGIFVAIAIAVRFQSIGRTGNRADSPEDALQADLEGSPDPTDQEPAEEDNPALNVEILNEPATDELPEATQTSEEAAFEMEGADGKVSALSASFPLRDLYGVSGQTVRFHVYYPDAVSYAWEYYDMEMREWRPATEDLVGSEKDALGRMTAYADFETPADKTELMIRCMYETEDAGETVSEMAFLRALPQEIRKLTAESITAEAGSYLAASEITVKVTYADNTSDVIDGLYGLYFMRSEVEAESSEFISADGILTERKVQTTQNHFYLHQFVSVGEESVTLAYLSNTEASPLLLSGTIAGTDEEPPVISNVDILTRDDIPDTEGEISITIQATAEDNVTPYPKLQYAVKETEEEADIGEISEGDWIDSPKITTKLQRGSTWFLCCRDQAGNVSFYKYEDIPEELPEEERDTQAPVIQNIYVEAN